MDAFGSAARQMHIGANRVNIKNSVMDIISTYRNDPTNKNIDQAFRDLATTIRNSAPEDIKSETNIDLAASIPQAQRTLRDLAAEQALEKARGQAKVDLRALGDNVENISTSDGGFYFPDAALVAAASATDFVDPKKAQISVEALKLFTDAKKSADAYLAGRLITELEHDTFLRGLREGVSTGVLKATLGLRQDNLEVGSRLEFHNKLREFTNNPEPYLGIFQLNPDAKDRITQKLRQIWIQRTQAQNVAATKFNKSQNDALDLVEAEALRKAASENRRPNINDYTSFMILHGADMNHPATYKRAIKLMGVVDEKNTRKIVDDIIYNFNLGKSGGWFGSQYEGPASEFSTTNVDVLLSLAKGNPELRSKIQAAHLQALDDRETEQRRIAKKIETDQKALEKKIGKQIKDEKDRIKVIDTQLDLVAKNYVNDMVMSGFWSKHDLRWMRDIGESKYIKSAEIGVTWGLTDSTDLTVDLSTIDFHIPINAETLKLNPVERHIVKNWSSVQKLLEKRLLEKWKLPNIGRINQLQEILNGNQVPKNDVQRQDVVNWVKQDNNDPNRFDLTTNDQAPKNIRQFVLTQGFIPDDVFSVPIAKGVLKTPGTALEFIRKLIPSGVPDTFSDTELRLSLSQYKWMSETDREFISEALPIVRDLMIKTPPGSKMEELQLKSFEGWMTKHRQTETDSPQDNRLHEKISEELSRFNTIARDHENEKSGWIWNRIFGSDGVYEAWSAQYSWIGDVFPSSPEGLSLQREAYKFFRHRYGPELSLAMATTLGIQKYARGVSKHMLPITMPDGEESGEVRSTLFAPENSTANVPLGLTETISVGSLVKRYPETFLTLIGKNVHSVLENDPEWGEDNKGKDHFNGARTMAVEGEIKLLPIVGESSAQNMRFDVFLKSRITGEWIRMPDAAQVQLDESFGRQLANAGSNFNKSENMMHNNVLSRTHARQLNRDKAVQHDAHEREEGVWWDHPIHHMYWLTNTWKGIKSTSNAFYNNVIGPDKLSGEKPKITGHHFGEPYYSPVLGIHYYARRNLSTPHHVFEKQDNFMRTFELVTELEGFRGHEYPDGGYKSIGHGTNLTWLTGREKMYLMSHMVKGKITEEQAGHLAKMRITKIFKDFKTKKEFKGINWTSLHPNRMAALAAMAYQVGMPEFKSWKNTLALVKKASTKSRHGITDQDWEKVAKEIVLNSAGDGPADWVKQTPGRVKSIVSMLKGGRL